MVDGLASSPHHRNLVRIFAEGRLSEVAKRVKSQPLRPHRSRDVGAFPHRGYANTGAVEARHGFPRIFLAEEDGAFELAVSCVWCAAYPAYLAGCVAICSSWRGCPDDAFCERHALPGELFGFGCGGLSTPETAFLDGWTRRVSIGERAEVGERPFASWRRFRA